MRISRLDLFGFKSFPDRTALQFGRGISCVVGPNGSGKSNVVDALKWVIGEQSARSLRGAEMSDVIFAGSTERKPVGFAEVSLTLDVDGGEPFPGEYANLQEIQVGRRLHRSGASEYLINQVKCRRKDVVDLFLDTGIGTNLYSFIEQGRVDKVVSATPNERRGLIDEAAGISRYKARREEARSRLEATAQQLDRAADVADEMGRRLKVLERQVIKAARFRRARARVRQREIYLSLVKYRGLAGDRRALQRDLREARSEEAAARRGLLRREEDLRVRREELGTVDEAARTWRDELAEVDARLRELQSQEALQGQRSREAGEQVAAAAEELQQVGAEREALEGQLEEAEEALKATEEALAGEGSSAEARAAERAESQARVAVATTEREAAESSWQELQAALARLEAEAAAVTERRASLPNVAVKLEAQQATLVEDLAQAAAEVAAAVEEAELSRQVEARAATDVAAAEEALAAVDAERTTLQQAHETARSAALSALGDARRHLDALRSAWEKARAERTRAREEAAAELRRRRDDELLAARRRADVWVDGVEAEARRREDAARARLEAEQERWHRLEVEAEAEAQRDAEGLVAKAIETSEQRVRQALAPLEQAVRRERGRLERARDDAERARVALADAEARIAGNRGRLRLTERPEALASARSLIDRLPPEEAGAALAAWGRRAALPALRTAREIEDALGALGEGAAVELWWWREQEAPDPSDAADIAQALEQHLATGASVRFPGGRVESDGVVSVGLQDAAAERVAARQALEAAEADAGRAADALERAAAETAEAEGALEGAEAALVDARRQGDRALADARSQAHEVSRGHVREALEALAHERDATLEALRDVERRLRSSGAEAVQAARSDRGAFVDRVAVGLDMELEEALAALPPVDQEGVDDSEAVEAVSSAQARVEATSAPPSLPDRGPATQVLEEARRRQQGAVEKRASAVGMVERREQHRDGLRARQEELEARLREVHADIASWEARSQELGKSREELGTKQAAAEARKLEAAAALQSEQERHQDLVVRTEGADAERRARLARREDQRARREELGRRIAGLEERRARVAERQAQAAARVDEATRAAETAAQERRVLTETRGEVFDKLERERGRRAELQEGIRTAEEDLHGLRKRSETAVRTTQQLVDRSAAVRAEIDALRERMDDRYQVGMPGLLDRIERSGKVVLSADDEVAAGRVVGATEVPGVEPFVLGKSLLDDEAAVRSAVEELAEERRRLASLGEVHLGALEEYEELAERHSDLEAQRADLEGSVGQLRAAIAKMNRTCRERFRDAFDRVNENFQLSYPKLLGGGSARLALTDDEDLLETGVEIFVQPPGKRLQHLQLLSGGEKAMTAIALLIALFRVKPSPFCVLDEVDAPLDERNGGRFNTMLRELAETSQFVVITHNRKTMECADTLYGISMTRPGVSTLVTVSLADAPTVTAT